MTDTAFKTRTEAAAPGSARAFLDNLQREVDAIEAGDRSGQLVRGVTDDHPVRTALWIIAAATVVSCLAGWAIVHFHLG